MGPAANPTGNGALRPTGAIRGWGVSNAGPNAMFYRGTLPVFWKIIGVTRDASGAPLGNCNVDLFQYGTNAFVTSTTSDVGGNYLFMVPSNGPYFVRVVDSVNAPTVVGSSLIISPV